MPERSLLEQALGVSGRLVAVEPFGEGRIARFTIDEGEHAGEWFVDTSRQSVPVETGFVVRSRGALAARIWKHPDDPRLPALRDAVDPERLARIAAAAGFGAELQASVLSYRPGMRAVVRLQSADRQVFLKVVRPGDAEALVDLHDACLAAGVPAARVQHWSRRGLVILEDAVGVPGPVALASIGPATLLDAVDALRAAFPAVTTSQHARASVGTRWEWHLDRLRELLPSHAEVIDGLAPLLAPHVRQRTPAVTVHGDLHLGQLFFTEDGKRIASVIDIDTTGKGDPSDDAAAFIGHALASAVGNAAAGRAQDATLLEQLAAAAQERWATTPHTSALATLHVLGHSIRAAERGQLGPAAALLERARGLARALEPAPRRRRAHTSR